MPDDKRNGRDTQLFVLLAVLASMVLGAVLWLTPTPVSQYTLRNSMFLVPTMSVMIAALGIPWRRKLLFVCLTFFGFIAVDLLGAELGLLRMAADARYYGTDGPRTILTLAYHTFVIAYPLVLLVLFVGSRPSMLWTRVAPPEPAPVRKRR